MKCYFCGREVFFMIFVQSNLVIDGGYNEWTDWSEWSECTATCGGEVVIIQEPAPTRHRKIKEKLTLNRAWVLLRNLKNATPKTVVSMTKVLFILICVVEMCSISFSSFHINSVSRLKQVKQSLPISIFIIEVSQYHVVISLEPD